MNITFPILTCSRIARSFKTYHRFEHQTQETKSTIHLVDHQPLNFSQKSIDQLLQKKKNSLNSSRLVFLTPCFLSFSANGRGKERRRVSCCASKIEMRTRAFPFACVRCQRACTRRAQARVRAHRTHATTHSHVQACRRARNVGIT